MNRDVFIQIRATQAEKKLFQEKGGSEGFRKWLNGLEESISAEVAAAASKHNPRCPCAACVKARAK